MTMAPPIKVRSSGFSPSNSHTQIGPSAMIAAARIINIIVSGMAGVLVPVMFERLNQDPAVASSVFVTMITDSMGFFAFLGLAVASGLVG